MTGADAAIVIEVAESTVERDRLKRAIYVRERIPIFGIVNLVENQIEVYSGPISDGRNHWYSKDSVVQVNESISLEFPKVESMSIAVDNLIA